MPTSIYSNRSLMSIPPRSFGLVPNMSMERPEVLDRLRAANTAAQSVPPAAPMVPVTPTPSGGSFIAEAGLPTLRTAPIMPYSDPIDKFNQAVLSIMRGNRVVGEGMTNQLQQAGFQETLKATPEELRILSPQQQAQLRAEKTGGITDAMNMVTAAVNRFEDTLKFAKEYGEEYAKAVPMDPTTIESYINFIRQGGTPSTDALDKLMKAKRADGTPALTTDDWIAWGEANKKGTTSELDKYLTPTEAKTLGVPYGTTREEAALMGITPTAEAKPATADQNQSAGYAERIKQSIDIFDKLANQIVSTPWSEAILQRQLPTWAPFKKDLWNHEEQAERNFINAILRQESGAAIAESEFESARQQYFPQPGDDAATLAQKAENRRTTLKSMIRRSGPALSETAIREWGFDPAEFSKTDQDEINRLKELYQSKGYTEPFEEMLKLYDLETIRNKLGFNNVGGDTNKATAMRTDRHNNPTAFTTNIAQQAGLQLGVDYKVGDPFPTNPNLRTATLLKDPIATTIKVIDKLGFYTANGKQRWNHTAMSTDAWRKLSPEQKKAVVYQMYQKEGNQGLLNRYFA